ncbi:serine hydrolase domain-containing protein [Nitrospira japonica]|nr:serine hydrolase domain-containing protein [Nitrospira japonica]
MPRTPRTAAGFRLAAILAAFLLLHGCSGGGSEGSTGHAHPTASCSAADLEGTMDSVLSGVASPTDFSFSVKRPDGRQYVYSRGASTLQTSYSSASTSKLVSAVIIMRLVEQGRLSLASKPQDLIGTWPIGGGDPLLNMTLAQLLSFTSGLTIEPSCLDDGTSEYEACVTTIGTANGGTGITPGQQFFYASTHLQVAGLMAIKARPAATWQDVFLEFKQQTNLFPTASYDSPSPNNPALAGGMHWTGEEYLAFLDALRKGELLNAGSMGQLLADHTASAAIVSSPIAVAPPDGLGEDWHYGFGLWHECQSANFNCTPGTRVSSPGIYGAYPFWDRSKGYVGIVAMQGPSNSIPIGIGIERSVRPTVEQWVACQ